MSFSIRPLWGRIVKEVLSGDRADINLPVIIPPYRKPEDAWSVSATGACMVDRTLLRAGVERFVPFNPIQLRAFAWGKFLHYYTQHLLQMYAPIFDMGEVSFIEKELVNELWNAVGHMDFRYIWHETGDFDIKTVHPQFYRHLNKHLERSGDPYQAHTYWWQSSGYGITKKRIGIDRPDYHRIWTVAKGDFREAEIDLTPNRAWVQAIDEDYAILNESWEKGLLPPCTCTEKRNEFMISRKWCAWWEAGEPCCLTGTGIVRREDAVAYFGEEEQGEQG